MGSNTKFSSQGLHRSLPVKAPSSHFGGSETLWGALGLLIPLCTELKELSCPLHVGTSLCHRVTSHLLATAPPPSMASGLAAAAGRAGRATQANFCPQDPTFMWHLGRMQRMASAELMS